MGEVVRGEFGFSLTEKRYRSIFGIISRFAESKKDTALPDNVRKLPNSKKSSAAEAGLTPGLKAFGEELVRAVQREQHYQKPEVFDIGDEQAFNSYRDKNNNS
jgi:hypothetical protein